MSTDQPETFSAEPAPPQKKSGGCLKGCLIVVAIAVVLGGLAAVVVAMNWKSWAASTFETLAEQMLVESGIPDTERGEVMTQFKRLTTAFKAGDLSVEQLQPVLEQMMASPALSLIGVKAIEAKYLDASGLSDEEKQAGSLLLRRYAAGLAGGAIEPNSVEGLLDYVTVTDAEGNREFLETVPDENLRQLLADVKAAVEEAGVPEQVEPVDPSAEIKKIVDAALGEAPAPLSDAPGI